MQSCYTSLCPLFLLSFLCFDLCFFNKSSFIFSALVNILPTRLPLSHLVTTPLTLLTPVVGWEVKHESALRLRAHCFYAFYLQIQMYTNSPQCPSRLSCTSFFWTLIKLNREALYLRKQNGCWNTAVDMSCDMKTNADGVDKKTRNSIPVLNYFKVFLWQSLLCTFTHADKPLCSGSIK